MTSKTNRKLTGIYLAQYNSDMKVGKSIDESIKSAHKAIDEIKFGKRYKL